MCAAVNLRKIYTDVFRPPGRGDTHRGSVGDPAYSVWFKPYGLYCQGSRWGDFSSINRWVEINLHKLLDTTERPVFIVHRLDRATSGLILLCHTKNAARLFSAMFQSGNMDKRYQVVVRGDFSGELPLPQDLKASSFTIVPNRYLLN